MNELIKTISLEIPVVGQPYKLYQSSFQLYSEKGKEVQGIYLGKVEAVTPNYIRLVRPEGHIFAVQNNEQIEVYCTRTNDGILKYTFQSDGEDDPAYPLGIEVSRFDNKYSEQLNKNISEFLTKREVAA